MGTLTFNVTANLQVALDAIDNIGRQAPYGASRAINQTAKDVQAELTRQLPIALDRPVPFTLQAIGITYSTKTNLLASVFIKDRQLQYLKWQIGGGVETSLSGKAYPLPTDWPRDAFGNIGGRAVVKRLLARPDVFCNAAGIWQRLPGHRLARLFSFERALHYTPRYDFAGIAQRVIEARIDANLRTALADAIATAR